MSVVIGGFGCGFRFDCVGFIFPRSFEGIHSILNELTNKIFINPGIVSSFFP